MSGRLTHPGISCDLCWVSPIIGTRYKARNIYDFDICENCLAENDDCNVSDFVAFDQAVTAYRAASVGPSPCSMLRASSPGEAAVIISQDNGRHDVTAVLTFNQNYSWHDNQELASALAQNTSVVVLRVHICGSIAHEGDIASIARGIAENRTIERVTFHLSREARKSISESDRQALYDMITKNKSVKGLYFLGNCHCSLYHDDQNFETDENENSLAQSVASALFYNTSLKQVRLDSFIPLSRKTKACFIEAAQKNTSLVRVYAKFSESDDHLDLLLENNRYGWCQRFCNISAPLEDRVGVLLEVKSLSQLDPVEALFFLINNCPDILPETELKEGLRKEPNRDYISRGVRRFVIKLSMLYCSRKNKSIVRIDSRLENIQHPKLEPKDNLLRPFRKLLK